MVVQPYMDGVQHGITHKHYIHKHTCTCRVLLNKIMMWVWSYLPLPLSQLCSESQSCGCGSHRLVSGRLVPQSGSSTTGPGGGANCNISELVEFKNGQGTVCA